MNNAFKKITSTELSTLKRIAVYVSDHGYGHAARTIGLLRQLKTEYEIIVKNSNAYYFLKQSLPGKKIINLQTDVGPITSFISKNSDSEKTYHIYSNWIKNENNWIKNELEYFKEKRPDLIISDISPISIRLAKKMQIPSISIANFTWIDILEKLPFHKNKDKVLDWLNDSFQMTDLCIMTPFHMNLKGMKQIKKSSPICRNVTTNNKKVLKKLNLSSKPITVYLGNDSLSKISVTADEPTTKIVYLLQNNIKIDKKIMKTPEEGQNIISASNLVVSKPGYSIISECVNSRCPMLLIPRKNYPEDEALCKECMRLGIAKILDIEDNPDITISQSCFKELKNNIKENQIKKLESLPKARTLINEFLTK